MSELVTFLPWVRSGLGLSLDTVEPATLTDRARNASFTAFVELDGDPDHIERRLDLRPPDHATGIDANQISRRYPSPGTVDAEYGYFPHIEFTAPDLPWVLSPASADEDTGRLRPWIVLVCTEASKATLQTVTTGSGQVLHAAAADLPDLNESYAWAHVQSAVGATGLADAAHTGAVVARLLCPRELSPNTRYLAAVVNAWKAGDDALLPAWAAGDDSVTLTVYDHWTFTTGQVGSFEELVERLHPVADPDLEFGIHPVDITELGLVEPAWSTDPVRALYRGAIADAMSTDVLLSQDDANAFASDVAAIVEQGTQRRVLAPNAPDPRVAPPAYGAFARGHVQAQGFGWMPELNTVPARRFAAGLGAALVRTHQERFMATAWDQAGQIREANRVRSQALLRQAQGETHRARTVQLEPFQMFGVLGPQLSFVRIGTRPVKAKLNELSLPNGMRSAAMARALRPSGVVARSYTAPLNRPPVAGWEDAPQNFRKSLSGNITSSMETRADRATLGLATPRRPGGMRLDDPRRTGITPRPTPIPQELPSNHLSTLRDNAAAQIQPRQAARTQLLARVPALASQPGPLTDGIPAPASSGPVFTEPLSIALMQTSPDLIMPGADLFPDNSVRMLVADSAFVAAFLAGANHEMIAELIWREYPARMTHTAFRRFWARPDPADLDIDPIDTWDYIRPLAYFGAAGGESAILMVRGDLLRQYPAARFLLLAPGEATPIRPAFTGIIPPDTAFYGFDVPKDEVTAPDSEWVVIIEEPPQEPRFGLDTGPSTGQLKSYSELSWSALENHEGPMLALESGDHFEGNGDLKTEATWGLNGAHMALATHQKPFRLRMRVVDLLGGD